MGTFLETEITAGITKDGGSSGFHMSVLTIEVPPLLCVYNVRDLCKIQVEGMLKKCKCGGHFKFDAKPKCPKCRSLEYDESEPTLFYD